MKRALDFETQTDGHLYTGNDLVKLGCGGCKGCSECCSNEGVMIILDPYDVFMLTVKLGKSFQQLFEEKLIRLQTIDGAVLPGLGLKNEGAEREECIFLNREGRCSIHDARPGICRLFPLGRLYDLNSFSYILQTGECPKADGTKYKVSKWIGIPDFRRYEQYVLKYHGLLTNMQEVMSGSTADMKKKINMGFLQLFFMQPYDSDGDFYSQFEERVQQTV